MPRSLLRAFSAGAVLLLVLTGCSSGSEDTAPSAEPAAGGAFPVTLNHAFGSTTIERAPQRVVTIGYNEADFAMALGVQPVAEREFIGDFPFQQRPWLPQPPLGPTPQVLDATTLPVEQIAALRPDVILGVYSFIDKPTYDRLARIAPTVAQSTPDGTNPANWEEQTRITGQALGRTEQAEQVITDTRRTFTDAIAAHPEFRGKRLSMDFVLEGKPINMGTDDLRAQLFAGLGFTVRPDSQNLSLEQQGRLDNDVIVVLGRTKAESLADPVFAAIPAVREGRVAYLGDFGTEFAGALGYSSPLSLSYAIDDVSPKLSAALRGEAPGA
ncbi:iron complex transport system substrate-binding protein [Pseudonocardia sediminis]|uniref:Iron complex transport system substrate-binding protein n=1 Tax=Pseudonocardia sediminis TaxID=1397368 RepID=A0A4V2FQ63_PSEST|nr:ABC transporter substrate-binding protein [Pseudonocardia sediminis]RZT83590.1 iron complex transport system substrate-binding protein [Pseudonocardia sediminis]